ncbi:MAG TPA: hypothetical protein PK566_12480 [Pseudobacteroides sp.]|nr:hypothetical protein [Pseudobacteroides sp.]
MSEELFEACKEQNFDSEVDASELVDKIEEAYKAYESCENSLNKWIDDYGEYKIAKLRLEFLKHELGNLIKVAEEKGIDISTDIKNAFYSQSEENNSKV